MSRRTVAIVDDQRFICETLESMLKNTYEVCTFVSGEAAVNFITQQPVDIILLDYDMPKMSGYEVLLAIKANAATSAIPVIFLTADTNEHMKKEMMTRGAADYICKPIDSTLLHGAIKKYLP